MRPSKTSLVFSLFIVLVLGLVTVWSTVPDLFLSQIAFAVAGIIIAILFTRADINLLLSFGWAWYAITIFLLILTEIIGPEIRGSVRWIDLGFFNMQTSELAKPFLVFFYTNYLAKHDLKTIREFLKFIVIIAIPSFLVARQPDLGSALTLTAFPLVILALTGHMRKLLVLALISLVVIVPLESRLLKPYQRERIDTFLNPYKDPKGAGYNVIQANIAIGSGGIIGKGVRLGTQSHLNFLPERHTDFIFASYAEELGLIGVLILFSAYGFYIYRQISIAELFRQQKYSLLSLGIISIFLFQIVVNIGMNLGIMPVTGITLPIFSYGGSSLLSFSILVGIHLRLLDLLTPFEL